MIKKADAKITVKNYQYEVQSGSVIGSSAIESMLRLMNGIYAPIFLETSSLPETISNDFSARMHRFLGWNRNFKSLFLFRNLLIKKIFPRKLFLC